MKYLGFTFLTLVLVLSAETRAQDNPFKVTQGSGSVMVVPTQAPCPDYKIGIITPPKDVDFKMRVTTPSKNLDPGIIFKPCEFSSQLSLTPQLVRPNSEIQFLNGPSQEIRDFLKGQLIALRRRPRT